MALTNPEKVVTEQRLNEYHQTILPYLGGMPDVLANKFNKSDLYSTDETMIGRWIDGKPLYQKTFLISSASSDKTLEAFSGKTFIAGYGSFFDTDTYNCIPTFETNSYQVFPNVYNDNLVLKVKGFHATNIKLTVQYTKTSDSPVAIGSDTDYSTTEKIVGTWVDGKALWKRTYDKSSSPVTINISWVTIDNAPDIARIIKAEVIAGSSVVENAIEVDLTSNGNVNVSRVGNNQSDTRRLTELTIWYTKKS